MVESGINQEDKWNEYSTSSDGWIDKLKRGKTNELAKEKGICLSFQGSGQNLSGFSQQMADLGTIGSRQILRINRSGVWSSFMRLKL